MNLGLGLGLTARPATSSAPSRLSDIVSGVVAEWQASQYSGSGNLLNLATAPADGSAQSAYDLAITGATFDTDKFTLDGSDYFQIATNTTFLNNLHKTGSGDFSFAWAGLISNVSATRVLMSTHAGGTNHGLRTLITSSDTVSLIQRGSSQINVTTSGTITPAVGIIVITSVDRTANETTHWIGTSTGETVSQTFAASTTDPTGPFTVCAESDAGFPMSAGSEYYGGFIRNQKVTDNTEAAALISFFETQTGKDLTP